MPIMQLHSPASRHVRCLGCAPSVSPRCISRQGFKTSDKRVRFVVNARRGDSDWDPPRGRRERRGDDSFSYEIRIGENEVRVNKSDVSGLILPGIATLAVLSVVGPLVAVLGIAAAGVGVAVAGGMMMSWLLVPLLLLGGLTLLPFGGLFLAFGAFSLIGSLIKLGVVGTFLWAGWSLAKRFMSPAAAEPIKPPGSRVVDTSFKDVKADDALDDLQSQYDRELREFDNLLKERDSYKRRVEDFRKPY